jgi:PAS domain S-box-containing protein
MSSPTILIVEDEAIVALDLKSQLEDLGYTVVGTADCADRALALARGKQPSLILMDVMLKGPMDGIEIAAELSKEQDTPVIFLTSFSDADTVQRAARTAPYGYLTKPFQVKELAAGIEVALHKARMERQLRESERWFASTLRCVQDGVIVTEPDATVRFLNRAAEDLTGWRNEDAVGRAIQDVVRFKTERPPSAVRAIEEDRVVGVERSRALCGRGGGMVQVDESAAPVHDQDGHKLGAVMVLRDVRERIHQEERLRASEERFRNAFDFAPLGMALISMDGRFIQVNEALCQLLGHDAATLRALGHHAVTFDNDLPHEQQRLHELFVQQQGAAYRSDPISVVPFEKRYVHRDGHAIWTLVSVSMLHEAGEPVCYLYQVNDLTAQKEAAQQLARVAAERMEHQAHELASQAKSEFLSRMSHEMRTPLNAVLGFAQLLQMRPDTDVRDVSAYSEHILNAGRHLLALVEDVLDLQRVAEGRLKLEMGAVSLSGCIDMVEQFLAPTAQARQVSFERDMPHADLHIWVDAVRLRQVLLNLGSNAVKYNRTGGKVSWKAEALTNGNVALTVKDNGEGMSAEQQAKLFQPFERLGRETSTILGSGLGLVITRKLVEEMGGTIEVDSRPGEGTCMRVTFRAATPARAASAQDAQTSPI